VALVVAETDVVSESERDDHLRVFSHHAIETEEVEEWLREHTDLREDAVLSPEEIARALSEADRVLALPDAALRALPDDALATLPDDARRRIRERLAR
jgi:hypothetical protein